MKLITVERGFISINTMPLIRRIILSIIVLSLISPAIYRSYAISRADLITGSEQTIENYSLALEYDGANAMLWWNRGRSRHYSYDKSDISLAISDYQRALSLNPRLTQAWVDLADCYNHTALFQEAEVALERAFATRPYSALIRWQAGNFFLRRGNLPKMFECFKLASEYDREKLAIAMNLAWKVDGNHQEILQKLVPDDLPSNLNYLDFLVSRNELDLARPVWQRFLHNDIPTEYEVKVSLAFPYIDQLLAKKRVTEALQVWDDVLQKAGTGLYDNRLAIKTHDTPGLDLQNVVWNGSFENEILKGGFDWRYPDMREVQFQIDLRNRMEGLKCLRVVFSGSNVSFNHLRQIVPIFESGSYQLDLYLRTEGLTTDQKPYISIEGYPDGDGTWARTDLFPATTSWSKISVPFTVKQGFRAVEISLRRNPSLKFDSQIKGSLWLDGVAIYRQQGPEAPHNNHDSR